MQYISIPANTTYPLILGDDINAMNTAKIYLLCDTSSGVGAINILLPKITDGNNSLKNWWFEIFINDIGGNASVNNIKITPNPADKINGSGAQVILDTNGITGRIVVTGKTAWDFNVGASSSGGCGVQIIDSNAGFSQVLDFTNNDDGVGQEIGGVGNTGNFVQTIPANTIKIGDIYRFTINVPVDTSEAALTPLRFGLYRDFQNLLDGGIIAEISQGTVGGNNIMPPQSGTILGYGGGIKAIVEMQIISIVDNMASTISTITYTYSNPPNASKISSATMSNVPLNPIEITIAQKFSFVGGRDGGLGGNTAQATLMMIERLRKC